METAPDNVSHPRPTPFPTDEGLDDSGSELEAIVILSAEGRVVEASHGFARLVGYSAEELGSMGVWDWDCRWTRAELKALLDNRGGDRSRFYTRHRRKDGVERDVEVHAEGVAAGGERRIRCHCRDITLRRSSEFWHEEQARVLEMIVQGAPRSDTLERLVLAVEAHDARIFCSVLLLDPEGVHLRHGVAPSLPPEYVRRVDGIRIGPAAGSCGTAAFVAKPVHVEDILADPLWADFREVARLSGMRACWSHPIMDTGGEVLGTIAVYHRRPGLPTPLQEQLIATAAHTAALCLSRFRIEEERRQTLERLDLAVTAARIGVWEWDIATSQLVLTPECARICRLDRQRISLGEFRSMILPEDLERTVAAVDDALDRGTTFRAEFRIRRADGAIRSVEILGRGRFGPDGKPIRGIGTVHDVTDRRRAEDELKASETRFRALVEGPDVIVWEFDPSRNALTYVSPQAQGLGYPMDDWLVPGFWQEHIHPEDRAAAVSYCEMQTLQGMNHQLQYRFATARGDYVWLDDKVSVEQQLDGRVILRGVWIDITHRRRIEEALHALASTVPGGAADAAFFQQMALQLSQVFRSRHALIAEIVPALPDSIRTLGVCRDGGIIPNFEKSFRMAPCARVIRDGRYFAPSGVHRDFSADPLFRDLRVESYLGIRIDGSAGQGIGLLAILDTRPMVSRPELLDLLHLFAARVGAELERRQTYDALQSAEARFRSAIEHSHECLVLNDRQGICTYVSPSVERITGIPAAELIGQPSRPFVCPDDLDRVGAFEQKLLSEPGATAEMEIRVRHRDGSWRWIQAHGRNRLEDPNLRTVVTNFRDITERKQAAENQARLESQLIQARKMEALGSFAGGIAHDFNNLLGAIMGYAELARMESEANPAALASMDDLLRTCHRTRDLVKQILTFGRRESQPRAALHLHPIVDEALQNLATTLPPGIEIRFRSDPSTPPVVADATAVHQVVLNLVTNSAQALATQNGTIDVELADFHVSPEFAAHHPGIEPGHHARLTVRDNGPGMPPEVLERIFEPFFTTKGARRGLGLGLSVVHGIVHAHHGLILVQSSPGAGTTIEIYLPRSSTMPVSPPQAPSDPPPQSPGGESLLFVDDEPALLSVTEQILRRSGYDVTACLDAETALEAFGREPQRWSLVITDYDMPRMNGLRLGERLRAIRPDVPMLICTGYGAELTPSKAAAAGFNELLLKPVSIDALRRAIRRVLDGSPDPAVRQ